MHCGENERTKSAEGSNGEERSCSITVRNKNQFAAFLKTQLVRQANQKIYTVEINFTSPMKSFR